MIGIRDLLLKHPVELTLHKYAVIEKLRERIGDDDKVVRETLYQLFKSVIFPGCKEVNLCFLGNFIVLELVIICSGIKTIMYSSALVLENKGLKYFGWLILNFRTL